MRPRPASDPGSRRASSRPRCGGTGIRRRCPIPVGPSDEVALIPPVSGGSDTMRGTVVDTSALTGVIAVLVLIGANIADGLAWWAAALVAVAAGWVIDLGNRLASRGRDIAVNGLLLARGPGGGFHPCLGRGRTRDDSRPGHRRRSSGWGVALPAYRAIESIAPAVMIAIIAGAAVGSLMLARTIFEPAEHAASIFMVVVVDFGADRLGPRAGAFAAHRSLCRNGAGGGDLGGGRLVDLGRGPGRVSAGRSRHGGRSWSPDAVSDLCMRTGRLALSEPATRGHGLPRRGDDGGGPLLPPGFPRSLTVWRCRPRVAPPWAPLCLRRLHY